MILEIIFVTIIGAIIGWITNVLAIKMLFRPAKAFRIPVLNISIQGLIPKRRNEISKSIGEIVEKELISITDIMENFLTEENKSEAIDTIKAKIIASIDKKIPTLIPASIKKKIFEYIGEQIETDGKSVLNNVIHDFTEKTIEQTKISKMVEKKIDEFELDKIESIILEVSKKELKHIEVLGGVLGAAIGLLQGIIVQFIR